MCANELHYSISDTYLPIARINSVLFDLNDTSFYYRRMVEKSEVSRILTLLQREEVFEDENTIFFTHEVDPAYENIVREMARAIYQHDKTSEHEFPTGDPVIDDPYLCRADDALRVGLPLLRKKFAEELASELGS